MNLPKNGRIVVIDDNPNDAGHLMQALSQQSSPVHYFMDPNPDFLPKEPLQSVRLVFLDLDLGIGNDDKSKASATVSALRKIVSVKNRPFVIVAWTTNAPIIEHVQQYVQDAKFQSQFLSINKQDCITDEKFDITKINSYIKENLANVEMLHLFVDWENIIHHASGTTVDEFSNFFPYDDNWNQNISNLFWKLAKARTDKQMPDLTENEIVQNALALFTSTFLDSVNTKVTLEQFSQEIIDMIKKGKNVDSSEINARVNSKLFLSFETNSLRLPGNIYADLGINGFDKDKITNGLITGTFENDKKEELISKAKLIFLEINPVCDYAQKKRRTHRLIPGIIWPHEFKGNFSKETSVYQSPLIYFNGELCYFVFDLGSVTSVPLDSISQDAIISVRQEFLINVQSLLSSHVSRPGTSFLE